MIADNQQEATNTGLLAGKRGHGLFVAIGSSNCLTGGRTSAPAYVVRNIRHRGRGRGRARARGRRRLFI
jgi:hypothetical protein